MQILDRFIKKYRDLCLKDQTRFRIQFQLIAIGCIMVFGAIIQAYINQAFSAIPAGILFLIVGILFVYVVFRGKFLEIKTFSVIYSICVLIGGLAQLYSMLQFQQIQSTPDAINFYSKIFEYKPYYSWHDCLYLYLNGKQVSQGAPLPVYLWQRVYHVMIASGYKFGLYLGLMFNALLVGISGSLTVHIARKLFGEDIQRLKKTAIFFSMYGLFWLFGGIFIRDSFALLGHIFMLFGVIIWLEKSNVSNFVVSSFIIVLSSFFMAFIRYKSIVMFGVVLMAAIGIWLFMKKMSYTKTIAIVVIVIVCVWMVRYLKPYIELGLAVQSERTDTYIGKFENSLDENSLAKKYIVTKPMPVRLVIGSITRLLFPFPIWGYLKNGVTEYQLLMTLGGIFQIITMPFFLTGCFLVFANGFGGQRKKLVFSFLVVYVILNYEAVLATSLEQRHLALSIPAYCLLSAIPDKNVNDHKKIIDRFSRWWWGYLLLIHTAYPFVKIIL